MSHSWMELSNKHSSMFLPNTTEYTRKDKPPAPIPSRKPLSPNLSYISRFSLSDSTW
jgi:hypothetical protein